MLQIFKYFVASVQSLPDGYVAHHDIGAAYKIHLVYNATWIESRDNCTIEGAKLAVIDTPKKLEYAKLQPMGPGVRHVGIQWVDGEWVSVANGELSSFALHIDETEVLSCHMHRIYINFDDTVGEKRGSEYVRRIQPRYDWLG